MTGDRAADLRTRQGELQRELSHAKIKLEATQGAVIENSAKSAQLIADQASVTSLESTLKVIASRLEAAEAREAAQAAQERREALKGSMTQAAEQATEHLEAIPAGIAELCRVIEPHLAQISRHVQLHNEARERFIQTGVELYPALKHPGIMPKTSLSTAAEIAADSELEQALAALKRDGPDPTAALTPLYTFALKTSRDRSHPEFKTTSYLNLKVFQFWFAWHHRQPGSESTRIWLKEP